MTCGAWWNLLVSDDASDGEVIDLPDDWTEPVWNLAQHSVLTELVTQNAARGLGLDRGTLESLAAAVTTNLEYAFDIAWAPSWVRPGEAHVWTEAARWFARCGSCLLSSPPEPTDAAARRWHAEHVAEHRLAGE